jgi:chromosome segregation ATPase
MGLSRKELELAYYEVVTSMNDIKSKAQAMELRAKRLEAKVRAMEKRITDVEKLYEEAKADFGEKDDKQPLNQAQIIDEWLNGGQG